MLDENGKIVDSLFLEIPGIRDKEGIYEHDPKDVFYIFTSIVRKFSKKYLVESLILSGYLFGFMAVDREGRPLTNIITWLDSRSRKYVKKIVDKIGARTIYEITGCPPLFIYPLSKLLWLKSEKELIYKKARAFLGVKGFILSQLFSDFVEEKSTASGTQLLDTHKLEWSTEVLDIFDIDFSKMPRLVESDSVVGYLDRDVAEKLGLRPNTPVVAGVFDGGAVAIGEGAVESGKGSSHLSTSAMVRVPSGKPVVDKSGEMRFQTYYLLENTWLPGGAVNNAGIVLKWFRENFGLVENVISKNTDVSAYEIIDTEAAKSPPGSRGLIFLPYISGERFPRFGNVASGVLYGLKFYHSRSDVIRSLYEGTIFNLKIILDAVRENKLTVEEVRVTGGGARSRVWLQIMADIFETKVYSFVKTDNVLLGSFIIAQKALGKIESVRRGAAKFAIPDLVFEPEEKNSKIYRLQYEKFRRLLDIVVDAFKSV
ncbi:MAG: hypothetical protein DRJ35_05505 [Thermoprotei archaeon]|nr:MAG: hypothetical protein DRJ35_05505 [Thermoprotei archaeon]